jgi:hypothetical protein
MPNGYDKSLVVSAVALGIVLAIARPALGADYECPVAKKFDVENEYPAEMIAKWRYTVRVEDTREGAFVSRCGNDFNGAFTCDRYEVDRVHFDANVRIKKFYVFRSHFDVQIFPNLTFVENNGRGTIAFGTCKVTSP